MKSIQVFTPKLSRRSALLAAVSSVVASSLPTFSIPVIVNSSYEQFSSLFNELKMAYNEHLSK